MSWLCHVVIAFLVGLLVGWAGVKLRWWLHDIGVWRAAFALILLSGVAHAENLAQPYPAPYHRAPDCTKSQVPGCITYGGLRPRRGYERDHFIPLCLLGEDVAARDPSRPPGPDNPGNVWYQPFPDANDKDANEDGLCRDYRRGEVSLPDAWQELRERWSQ